MRFCYYKLINDLCASLAQAAEYIRQSGDASLWSVCLEAADTIKSTLSANETSVGSDRIYSLLSDMRGEFVSSAESGRFGENIPRMISELSGECKKNIAYKLRVLFVADLGGKWDAMDSVYRAFKKRDDCDIDVVIQPIFRQSTGEDGVTRTETICDDYLTPMGIKNIPYAQYDMERIAPDITFISQPYESCTIPMFWPENIAKVSRLVYLPYFTAATIDKELSSAFDSFILSKTQKYSWKIACQTETMKNYYGLYASEKGQNVVVTGLPKWDYPLKLNKDNTPCPKDWRKKIEGRKVFLWNTHFNLSNQGIKIPDQGLDFLKIFSQDKKTALIWRPHPMTETVIKVYFPEKLPLYKRMMKTVADSDNMIIDKNSTYDCSFVWSDALISDASSMVDQYLLLDKPIIYTSPLSHIQTKVKFCTNDGLYDYLKLPWACSVDDVKSFAEQVSAGNDCWGENRAELRNTYYRLADGKCGERLTEILVNDILSESDA